MKNNSITKYWALLGMSLLLLTAAIPAAHAQSVSPDRLDYSLLNNWTFDHADIYQAKAHSLSDKEIATILKIAREADVNFRDVVAAVYRGETFAYIADHYGVPYSSLKDIYKDWEDVAAYEAAYQATGLIGERKPFMIPSSSS